MNPLTSPEFKAGWVAGYNEAVSADTGFDCTNEELERVWLKWCMKQPIKPGENRYIIFGMSGQSTGKSLQP